MKTHMQRLTHSATTLLLDIQARRGAAVMGSWFQDAVAAALRTFPEHANCYANPGAGQPDIISGETGFEVKSVAADDIALEGNYRQIQNQFAHFRLVAMRTDIQPFPLWLLELHADAPTRIPLRERTDPRFPNADIEDSFAGRLSELIVAAGTGWTREQTRSSARSRLAISAAALDAQPR